MSQYSQRYGYIQTITFEMANNNLSVLTKIHLHGQMAFYNLTKSHIFYFIYLMPMKSILSMFFSGIQSQMCAAIVMNTISPLNCRLVKSFPELCNGPFNIKLQTIKFFERGAITKLSNKVANTPSTKLLSEVSIKGFFLLCLNIKARRKLVLYLLLYLFYDQFIPFMYKLIILQLFLIRSIYYMFQSLFFSLKLIFQYLQSFFVDLNILVNMLMIFSSEVNCNTFIKIRIGHLINLLVQSIDCFLEANIFQLCSLLLIFYSDSIKMLLVIQILQKINIHLFIFLSIIQISTIINSTINHNNNNLNLKISKMSNNNNNDEATAIHQYLKGLIKSNRDIDSVSLEFKSIKDLLPYLHHFQKLSELKRLSLHGNLIRQLPADLTDVFPNLEELDLTNNPLHQNVQLLLISLKTLKKLRHIRCFIKKQNEYKIGQSIKTLEFVNDTKVFRGKAKVDFQFKNANSQTLKEFQEHIMDYFQSLLNFQAKYFGGHVQLNSINRFRQQISQISRQCIQNLTINKSKATPNIQYAYLFMAKFYIFDKLKVQILNFLTDIYNDVGKFMKDIFEEQSKIFGSLTQLTVTLTKFQIQSKERQFQEVYLSQFQKQHAIIHRNATMQNQIKRMSKQKDELTNQISKLQNHNKKLVHLLYQFSQGQVTNRRDALKSIQPFQNAYMPSKNKQQPSKNKQQNVETYKQKSPHKVSDFKEPSSSIQRPISIHKKSAFKSANKASSSKQASNSINIHNRSSLYHNANYSNSKSLTLNQLKQTINQIYQSKLKYDEKNFRFKMPRQTMNQYFFTFLSQKYGLRSLTIQAADNIISGIRHNLQIDNDIKVFYMIFKNQIDQQFRLIQEEIKITINKLLKKHIQSKMPLKSMTEINQILNRKIHGDISYQQSQDLIKFLYNNIDAQELLEILEFLFKERNNRQMQLQSQSLSSKKKSYYQSSVMRSFTEANTHSGHRKLQFSIFQKQILNFQLKKHVKHLKPLVDIFRSKDKNGDCIIDEQQFIQIIELLTKNEDGNIIGDLLQIIDPHGNRCITFTQMVRLAANYPQHDPFLNRFIQDKQ